ncbi:MAG: CoB--CoM heterodisulfide reductase iron-sulfur subunit B family protein [Proteobacteria bacterium]|nr:CoB--CoM heterodisulfide reductase iron-sulfur subunit B family protein [Pseudomonadota bacterium]
MDYGYYPGCSLKSTAKEYDSTVRQLCLSFGINLIEIDDWVCCGSSPVHALSEEISLALPLKNLSQAEGQGLKNILSPCPSCHSHMLCSHAEMEKEGSHRERLQELAGSHYAGSLQLRHLVDFLYYDVGIDKIKEKVTRPLTGIKAVAYYGCMTRFPGITFDDREMPTMIDDIVQALGAEALPWSHTTECCGASFSISKTETVLRLVGEILEAARLVNAGCIIAVCPLCQSNLDMRQVEIQKKTGEIFNLPVIYLSQLILMSQGASKQQLGFSKHMVDPKPLLQING